MYWTKIKMPKVHLPFEKLLLPEHDLDSTVGNDWIVPTAGTTPYLILLNDNRYAVGDIDDWDAENFYFENEWTAHGQAAIYYSNHGMKYPYLKEWNIALNGAQIPEPLTVWESSKLSKKMEFA